MLITINVIYVTLNVQLVKEQIMIIAYLVKKELSFKELNVLQNAQMDYMEMLLLNNVNLAQVLVILVMDQMMEIAYHAKPEDIYIIHNVYLNAQKNSSEIH